MEFALPSTIYTTVLGFPITDSFIGALIVSFVMVVVLVFVGSRATLVPSRLQSLFEIVTEFLLGLLENAFRDKKKARTFFPFFMTLMLLITFANQIGVAPLLFEITYRGADAIRQPTSDLSQTVALALIIFVLSNVLALSVSPMKHLSNFIAIGPLLRARSLGAVFQAVIDLFIGVLNIVGELAKVISLSCRLFGNIFAGNVMIAVIGGLAVFTSVIVPIPFIFLSIFSGFVQAFVFTMLGIQFVAGAIDGATPTPAETEPAQA